MKRHFWGFVSYFCQYSNLTKKVYINKISVYTFCPSSTNCNPSCSKSRNFILCAQFISRGYKLGMLKMYFLTKKSIYPSSAKSLRRLGAIWHSTCEEFARVNLSVKWMHDAKSECGFCHHVLFICAKSSVISSNVRTLNVVFSYKMPNANNMLNSNVNNIVCIFYL